MNQYTERINQLRAKMKERQLAAYIIVTDDFHGSEYVGDYFKARAYMSGFTGSAGTLVVLEEEAALWTDGRYFLQAKEQLQGSGIILMKSGQPGVPKIGEYLAQKLEEESVIGFDGRTMTSATLDALYEQICDMNMQFYGEEDLVDLIWEDRPALSKEPVWEMKFEYAGETRESKIKRLRKEIANLGADLMLISALDEIAWLLNLRGNDVECTPVFLAYMAVWKDGANLYIQEEILSEEIKNQLMECGITRKEYHAIYEDIEELTKDAVVLIDGESTNFSMIQAIDSEAEIIDEISPVLQMKAVKNEVECEHAKVAHKKDGVAVTKFMCWLKTQIGKVEMSEISVAEKLEEFRKEQENYLGESFAPIMAYASHGAIVHYSATEESNAILKPEGLLLSDTGAHYLEGTTDCTRTYVLGPITDEERRDYTLVLRGHINLAMAQFMKGVRGVNLDVLARQPLWEYGLDYNHGTGHGVGNVLSVHESPNAFRWQTLAGGKDSAVMQSGMITSNEPGVYITGKFGIRLENLTLCVNSQETEYGTFLKLDTLTLIPFDRDAIEANLLTDRELDWLNQYHKTVYDTLQEYMTEDERQWLKEATKAIEK